MAIGAIGGIGTAGAQAIRPPQAKPAVGFGDALGKSLEGVSKLEQQADKAATSFATGETTSVHEVMTATTKSKLAVDAVVAVRNRAVEAYQEIMRLQV
ncbi:MAG TPA: flagellar hook-basal body complex protein FliE [Euzebyales bacterium]|nr:flagellar hook-basal body complex protein FliE [Euzebyales bacterium]